MRFPRWLLVSRQHQTISKIRKSRPNNIAGYFRWQILRKKPFNPHFQISEVSKVEDWLPFLNDPSKRKRLEHELRNFLTPKVMQHLPLSMQYAARGLKRPVNTFAPVGCPQFRPDALFREGIQKGRSPRSARCQGRW